MGAFHKFQRCRYTVKVLTDSVDNPAPMLQQYGQEDDCCWGCLPLDSQKSVLLTHNHDALASHGAAICHDAIHCHGVFCAPWRIRDAAQVLTCSSWAVKVVSVFWWLSLTIDLLIYSIISEARWTTISAHSTEADWNNLTLLQTANRRMNEIK